MNLLNSAFENNIEIDGPKLIAELRNSLVHSEPKNRNKLLEFNPQIRNEILRLSHLYLQLGILYCLGYEGKFNNICNHFEEYGENMYFVPWVNGLSQLKTI